MQRGEPSGRKGTIIIVGLLFVLMLVALLLTGCMSVRVESACDVETNVEFGALSIRTCGPAKP
jgi:hypothetical protein